MKFRPVWLASLLLAVRLAAADGLRAAVAQKVEAEYPSLLEIYKDIHAHPELSFCEVRTPALIAAELRRLGFEVTEKVGGRGVVAVLKNGPGPTLLVRADMDALPIKEETGLSVHLGVPLGVEPGGVLVSYFADLDQWVVWIGESWLPGFMGRDGSREEFLAGDGLMRRKQELFTAAKARAAEAAARQRAEGREVSDAQLLKLTVDEVLDALILLYEPKSKP